MFYHIYVFLLLLLYSNFYFIFFVCGNVCLGFNKMKALILWESGVVEMGDV